MVDSINRDRTYLVSGKHLLALIADNIMFRRSLAALAVRFEAHLARTSQVGLRKPTLSGIAYAPHPDAFPNDSGDDFYYREGGYR